jgi:PPK2 family polyphosphate:nucleotide phosphotransferase
VIDSLHVEPGHKAGLARRDPAADLGIDRARALDEDMAELRALQDRLWAERSRSLLVILQGTDAAGKDSTIRHVFTGLNPHGCRVEDYAQPSSTELAHDYLWRVHAKCPARGQIGIWNRSHYEDVVAVRVHELAPSKVWRRRYRHICEFERMLADEGTTIVKILLHISRKEQGERLRARLEDPTKQWKFRPEDVADRSRFGDIQAAYEDAITKTSTRWAPWYVVPADRRWVRNAAVTRLLLETLRGMRPRYPDVTVDLSQVTID